MTAKTKDNGQTKSAQTLLKEEVDARKAWYAHFSGGAPQKP